MAVLFVRPTDRGGSGYYELMFVAYPPVTPKASLKAFFCRMAGRLLARVLRSAAERGNQE